MLHRSHCGERGGRGGGGSDSRYVINGNKTEVSLRVDGVDTPEGNLGVGLYLSRRQATFIFQQKKKGYGCRLLCCSLSKRMACALNNCVSDLLHGPFLARRYLPDIPAPACSLTETFKQESQHQYGSRIGPIFPVTNRNSAERPISSPSHRRCHSKSRERVFKATVKNLRSAYGPSCQRPLVFLRETY